MFAVPYYMRRAVAVWQSLKIILHIKCLLVDQTAINMYSWDFYSIFNSEHC